MTIGIIAAIVGIICCSIAFIINLITSNKMEAIVMLLLACFNVFVLKFILDMYNKPQEIQTTVVKDIQTTIVKDIKKFSVDSTLTISGADTTKTYTLTYWK